MDFYATLSRFYDELFPPNPKQIQFLAQHVPTHGKALDIGAGTGGYAAALSQLGAEVEALEILSMVPYLQKTAEKNGFRALDMGMEDIHRLDAGAYGLVYCIGNTLVHLENLNQLKKFLGNCRNLLREDGQIILQIVNYNRVIETHQTQLPVIQVPHQQLSLERNYEITGDSVRFITKLTHAQEHQISETTLLALKQEDLAHGLEESGFKEVQFYGDFEYGPWSPSSPATVVVAR